jgi:hypothetical protein
MLKALMSVLPFGGLVDSMVEASRKATVGLRGYFEFARHPEDVKETVKMKEQKCHTCRGKGYVPTTNSTLIQLVPFQDDRLKVSSMIRWTLNG